MTFELVRNGWPNTAAILALAMIPLAALTAAHDRQPAIVQAGQTEAAAICRTALDCPVIAAGTFDPTFLE